MSDENKNSEKNADLIMSEFLFKTIVSLQVTLSTISKDLDQKTDLLHEVTDSLTAMTYNMKEVRDKLESKDNNNKHFQASIDDMSQHIKLLEAKFESDNSHLQVHVKEIKYAIQELSNSMIELRTEKRVKTTPEDSSKKFDLLEMLGKVWEAIKNVKTISYIILVLALIIAYTINGSSFFPELLKIIKGLFKA
jgi:septal ring factor EnvC (AmiA/AmiB activator)